MIQLELELKLHHPTRDKEKSSIISRLLSKKVFFFCRSFVKIACQVIIDTWRKKSFLSTSFFFEIRRNLIHHILRYQTEFIFPKKYLIFPKGAIYFSRNTST